MFAALPPPLQVGNQPTGCAEQLRCGADDRISHRAMRPYNSAASNFPARDPAGPGAHRRQRGIGLPSTAPHTDAALGPAHLLLHCWSAELGTTRHVLQPTLRRADVEGLALTCGVDRKSGSGRKAMRHIVNPSHNSRAEAHEVLQHAAMPTLAHAPPNSVVLLGQATRDGTEASTQRSVGLLVARRKNHLAAGAPCSFKARSLGAVDGRKVEDIHACTVVRYKFTEGVAPRKDQDLVYIHRQCPREALAGSTLHAVVDRPDLTVVPEVACRKRELNPCHVQGGVQSRALLRLSSAPVQECMRRTKRAVVVQVQAHPPEPGRGKGWTEEGVGQTERNLPLIWCSTLHRRPAAAAKRDRDTVTAVWRPCAQALVKSCQQLLPTRIASTGSPDTRTCLAAVQGTG
eukprot:scaffold118754_cov72-Phaeocystis_antarctica.AAC.2